jgi:hypothetical protein
LPFANLTNGSKGNFEPFAHTRLKLVVGSKILISDVDNNKCNTQFFYLGSKHNYMPSKHLKFNIPLIIVCILCQQAYGAGLIENTSIDFFEIKLGETSPFPMTGKMHSSSPLPMTTFKVSLPDTSQIGFLSEFQMNVDKQLNLVSWIGFKAPFRSIEECHSASKQFMALTKNTYGLPNDSDERGFIDVTAGDIDAQVSCGRDPADSPVESLNVSIRSMRLTEMHRKKLDEMIGKK